MIKRSLLIFVVLLLSASAFGQQWTFTEYLNPTLTVGGGGAQFIVVDPDGKIWINPFSTPGDSIFVPDSNKYKTISGVYVLNPDGSMYDTVKSVTVGGTLYPFYSTGYGLEKDHEGNILIVKGSMLYRVNYQTLEGMNAVQPYPTTGSMGSPAVDAQGNIYLVRVLAGQPLLVLNPDFTFKENAVDTIGAIGRNVEVSLDGNTIYVPRFTEAKVQRWRRASEFDPYVVDTILHGLVCETTEWDPVDPTKLWMGTGNPLAGSQPQGIFAGMENTYLMFDTASWTWSDSIKWNYGYPLSDNERIRGLAFSLDGTKAYMTGFGAINDSVIQVHTNPAHIVSVEKEEGLIAENYSLDQNYPNPFNPSTSIRFSVVNPGFVTLKVYDMLGKEVAILISENLDNGSYTVSFDASKLASGTYVYRLTSNGYQLSKKMMLLK
jgi:hypothetical protein